MGTEVEHFVNVGGSDEIRIRNKVIDFRKTFLLNGLRVGRYRLI